MYIHAIMMFGIRYICTGCSVTPSEFWFFFKWRRTCFSTKNCHIDRLHLTSFVIFSIIRLIELNIAFKRYHGITEFTMEIAKKLSVKIHGCLHKKKIGFLVWKMTLSGFVWHIGWTPCTCRKNVRFCYFPQIYVCSHWHEFGYGWRPIETQQWCRQENGRSFRQGWMNRENRRTNTKARKETVLNVGKCLRVFNLVCLDKIYWRLKRYYVTHIAWKFELKNSQHNWLLKEFTNKISLNGFIWAIYSLKDRIKYDQIHLLSCCWPKTRANIYSHASKHNHDNEIQKCLPDIESKRGYRIFRKHKQKYECCTINRRWRKSARR